MKKFLTILLILTMIFLTGCTEDNKKSSVDEFTDDLTVYVWASSNVEFFTQTEIDRIKKCYSKTYPEVNVHWNIIEGKNKVEFGEIVNDNNDADVILSAKNMDAEDGSNISLKDTSNTKKILMNSTWCEMDERYIGIASICESVHLTHAMNLRKMLIEDIPDFYTEQKVLFIGNSYSYYNDLYMMFRNICINVGMSIDTDMVTKVTNNLSNFIDENAKEYTYLMNHITKKQYDYIFVQEQSIKPITAFNTFSNSVKELEDLIHLYNPNAKLILYETWARADGDDFYKDNPSYTYKSMEKALYDAYTNVANTYNLKISYAGIGVMYGYYSKENVNMYQSDLTHPTASATYLIALIHAYSLYGINPLDVSYVPTYVPEAGGGSKIQPTSEQCEILRNIAYDVCFNFDYNTYNWE